MRPLGRGHIHHTYLATYRSGDGTMTRWVHQRLNDTVFPNRDVLMANVVRVAAQLGARAGPGDARRAVLVRPAADGRPWAVDVAGAPWRTLAFIDRARSHRRFDGPAQAAEGAALAAGLVADLADLAPPPAEVIPGFHDVLRRLDDLAQARSDDVCGRAAGCAAEVDVVLSPNPPIRLGRPTRRPGSRRGWTVRANWGSKASLGR